LTIKVFTNHISAHQARLNQEKEVEVLTVESQIHFLVAENARREFHIT
jgi:hypothetical protein